MKTTVSFDAELWHVIEAAAARAGVDVADYISMAAALRAIADTEPTAEAALPHGVGSALSAGGAQTPARARLRGVLARRTAGEIQRESEAVMAEGDQVLRRTREILQRIASAGSHDSGSWDAVFRITPDWSSVQAMSSEVHDEHLLAEFGPWIEAVPPEDRSRVGGAIQEAIEHKDVVEMEHRLRCGDGRVRRVYMRAVPLLRADGRISEWLCAASEVAAPPARATGS
jgi:PAS domain-containing protein